jgi:hypothetical protein
MNIIQAILGIPDSVRVTIVNILVSLFCDMTFYTYGTIVILLAVY